MEVPRIRLRMPVPQRAKVNVGIVHFPEKEAGNGIAAVDADQTGIEPGEIKGPRTVPAHLLWVREISVLRSEFVSVLAPDPSEQVVQHVCGAHRLKVIIAAVSAEIVEPYGGLVPVVEHSGNGGNFIHAAIAEIVKAGKPVEIAEGHMVKQVGPEGVVPVQPELRGVVLIPKAGRVDHKRQERLKYGNNMRVMVRHRHVILIA